MNYMPIGSPYLTQAKLLATQNNVYPQQQQQQGYNSPGWGYETKPTPIPTPVPVQQQLYQHQQQLHPQQQLHQPVQPLQQHQSMPMAVHKQSIMQQQQSLPPQQLPHQQQQLQQQAMHSSASVSYNHQDYPNMVASSVPEGRKEMSRQDYPTHVVHQPHPLIAQLKNESTSSSTINNSSQFNHKYLYIFVDCFVTIINVF
jgi:hypothetical protein